MTPAVDINQLAIQNLPPNKRQPKWIMFIQALVYPIVWVMGVYRQYQDGGVVAYYSAAATYNEGERIVYNYGVYESLVNSNTGNTPNSSPTYWTLVNANFIGMAERRLYQGKKLILEYALNRYFTHQLSAAGYTGFRQPDSAFTPTPSDIYIEDEAPDDFSFVMYPTAIESSAAYPTYSEGYAFPTPVYPTVTTYTFNVNIPVAVFAEINADSAVAEKIVRNFVDKYAASGTFYNVLTY